MFPMRLLGDDLLEVKRDNLYIPHRHTPCLIHHVLSLCCHNCIYVTFTSKKGAGPGATSHRLIDVAVNESAPVSQITRQVVKFLKQLY